MTSDSNQFDLTNIDIDLGDSLEALLSSPRRNIDNINNINHPYNDIDIDQSFSMDHESPINISIENEDNEAPKETKTPSPSSPSPSPSPCKFQLPTLMNAVHMEVQENAKVPNLYHVPVRRGHTGHNSTMQLQYLGGGHGYGMGMGMGMGPTQAQTQTQTPQDKKELTTIASSLTQDKQLVDEIMRLTQEDLTLTENFLGSDHRMSAAAAYTNTGALMGSIGTKVAAMDCDDIQHMSDDNKKKDDTDISTNQDSTVVTGAQTQNIKNINNEKIQPPRQQQQQKQQTPQQTQKQQQPYLKQLHQSYSYGRSVPLPIPTKPNFTLNQQNQNNQNTNIASSSTSSSFAKSTLKTSEKNGYYLPPSPIVPAPTPSLLEATKKRSQFGFGSKHSVPSVPPPPTAKNTKSASNQLYSSTTTTKAASTAAASTSTNTKTSIAATPASTSSAAAALALSKKKFNASSLPPPMINKPMMKFTNHDGPSYERKKQRAKDARVKLNESIERLSVALDLAGKQSKQRAQTYTYWLTQEEKTIKQEVDEERLGGGKGEGEGKRGQLEVTSGITSTVTIMEETAQTADSAKKWERPSFVGSAATMVHSLNAQCEALMRELVELKKIQQNNCQCSRKRGRSEIEIVSSISYCNDDIDDNEMGVNLDKQQRSKKIKIEEKSLNFNDIIKRDALIRKIGSYLDPKSILRFICTSKAWQVQLIPIMKEDVIWSPLCIARFGSYNVREWQSREDENQPMNLETESDNLLPISHIDLYRKMNESNVKPKNMYEGNVSLGRGLINNAVCGWISAIERSNGETYRSVSIAPIGELKYASLPVVELRILIQNIGVSDTSIYLPEQMVSIDASTKRRGEEFFEITSDDRLRKKIYCIDGSIVPLPTGTSSNHNIGHLIKLGLFESAILCVYILAKGCPTTTKFKQRAKFAKILINIRGTTVPLVIPITTK